MPGLVRQRHIHHVLRTALVKPAMNSAANTHASSRKTQPQKVSQAAVTPAESLVRSQSTRATLVPTGRLRSSPTLTCWITVHDWPGVTVLSVCTNAPCEPSQAASTQDRHHRGEEQQCPPGLVTVAESDLGDPAPQSLRPAR